MADDQDHDHDSSRTIRIVNEYDFFDEHRTGPRRTYLLPSLKEEIMFPEILKSPAATPSSSSSSAADASVERKRKTDNDDDDQARSRSKGKGKERIIDCVDQESEDDDDDDYDYDGVDKNPASLATTDTDTNVIKKNPNSHDPRLVELIQQQPVLLFEKKLELSDVKQSQNRLLITGNERLMASLTEEERGKVENEKEKSVFLEVITADPNGVEYAMHLKKWSRMRAIVLNHEWFKLVRNNQLQKGDSVQGWGYRAANQFRLALNIIRKLVPQSNHE